jgi:hypothetical protein|tara:strand:- start:405 stop:737 length:333 start_codon:yes stop_codon:yes gene_type:complete
MFLFLVSAWNVQAAETCFEIVEDSDYGFSKELKTQGLEAVKFVVAKKKIIISSESTAREVNFITSLVPQDIQSTDVLSHVEEGDIVCTKKAFGGYGPRTNMIFMYEAKLK